MKGKDGIRKKRHCIYKIIVSFIFPSDFSTTFSSVFVLEPTDITHTKIHVDFSLFFLIFCIIEEYTLDQFNVGKHTLEDQMDLMNTHLLTSWV